LPYPYLSHTHEFVFQGDNSYSSTNPGFMTFIYTAGADLAVMHDNQIFSLENGGANFALSNLNPNNPNDFLTADIFFNTPAGTDELILNATIDLSTGGFGTVPEPSTLMLLGIGTACLLAYAWRRRRAVA
jgi:hypothetical protein